MASIFKQGQFWDHVAEDVKADGQPVAEARRLIESLVPLGMIRDHAVLDAGCGAGDFSAAMAGLGAREVIGLDVSVRSLQHAKCLTTRGEFDQASLCDLPYRSASFDVIWSWGVLHYVPNPQAALCEIARVLRPGGIVVIHTLRAGFWSNLELGAAKVFSAAPDWVERVILDAGERVVPILSWLITGKSPEAQTSKSIRQKLHERLFIPGDLHTFTMDQVASDLGPQVRVREAHPPVSDLFKRNMSLTVVARK